MKQYLNAKNKTTPGWQLDFQHYSSFTQLNNYCLNLSSTELFAIRFYSENKLILNNILDLDFLKGINPKGRLSIAFSNLKGFDANLSIFRGINYKFISLNIYFSSFEIYLKNKIFKKCNETYTNFYTNIFNNINSIAFLTTVKYSNTTCPLLFKDKLINQLFLSGISDTFFYKNLPGFVDLQLNENALNSTIMSLFLFAYKFNLDKNILNKDMFERTKSFEFGGSLNKIEPFELILMKDLHLTLINLDFFVFKNTKYFEHINTKDKIKITLSSSNNYLDENFCVYRNFRSYENITFSIQFIFKCNCTIVWILGEYQSSKSCPNKVLCNFQQFLNYCNPKFVPKNIKKIFLLNILYSSIEFNIFVWFLIPLACFFGFLSNIFSFMVLVKIRELSKEYIFLIMQMNSIVILTYCFINFIHFFNNCFFPNGYLCLNISKIIYVQYLEIVVYDFLGSILKTISNFLLALLAFYRYKLLKHGSNYQILTAKRKKCLIIAIFIFSCLNVEKLLNSFVNINFFPTNEFDYLGYPLRNTFKDWNYLSENIESIFSFDNFNLDLLAIFSLNFLINSLLLFVIALITDFLLLLQFRKDLKQVMYINGKMNASNLNDNNKSKKAENSRIKKTYYIIINSSIQIILRTCELGCYTYVVYLRLKLGECMSEAKFCSVFVDLGNMFYFMSSSFTVVIYYFLNQTFADNFKQLLRIGKNDKKLVLLINNFKRGGV
ncbi:unnamed protein product [Brachionus calyciflorus]|uniref:G-protein coupled receptors family 1 profile domain-containing protein n=1 Tax=Brachionus calyciflorus TaxID=104777 RepID=A0A814JBM4_9BILA|nr:unnamed protein product [Brachionus calyciflorus]